GSDADALGLVPSSTRGMISLDAAGGAAGVMTGAAGPLAGGACSVPGRDSQTGGAVSEVGSIPAGGALVRGTIAAGPAGRAGAAPAAAAWGDVERPGTVSMPPRASRDGVVTVQAPLDDAPPAAGGEP